MKLMHMHFYFHAFQEWKNKNTRKYSCIQRTKGVQSTSLFAFKIAYISEKQSNNVIEKRYSVFNENPKCLLGKNKLEKRKQRESPYV